MSDKARNESDTDSMILPMLREIRADMAKMADAMNTQSVEMRAMLKHLGGKKLIRRAAKLHPK